MNLFSVDKESKKIALSMKKAVEAENSGSAGPAQIVKAPTLADKFQALKIEE